MHVLLPRVSGTYFPMDLSSCLGLVVTASTHTLDPPYPAARQVAAKVPRPPAHLTSPGGSQVAALLQHLTQHGVDPGECDPAAQQLLHHPLQLLQPG